MRSMLAVMIIVYNNTITSFLVFLFLLCTEKYMYVIVFALNKFGLVLNGCKIVQYLKNENCVVFYTETNKCAKGVILFLKLYSWFSSSFVIFEVEGGRGWYDEMDFLNFRLKQIKVGIKDWNPLGNILCFMSLLTKLMCASHKNECNE